MSFKWTSKGFTAVPNTNLPRFQPTTVAPRKPIPRCKVLMLVLASDNQEIYVREQELWRLYMKSHSDVDCYFYKGDPSLDVPAKFVDDCTIAVRIEDTIENVYEKTLMVFEFMAPRLDNYDFVFRTNLSSFVVLDNYVRYCRTLPRSRLCAAVVGVHFPDRAFPAGCGFTMTPDIFRRILAERPPFVIQDDVTIGEALIQWGIPVQPAYRIDVKDWSSYHLIEPHIHAGVYHYRLKSETRHENGDTMSSEELEIMRFLIDQYYNVRPIQVVLRMCPDSRESLSGNGSRTPWFSKEGAFASMFRTKDARTHITVLFDGNSEGHWIRKYPVHRVDFEGGSGDASFLFQMRYIRDQAWSDSTIVYVLEDDYVHRPNWPAILREGFAHPYGFDYLTLYDHLDKYMYTMYSGLTSKIVITPSVHWRTVPSTTNTFAVNFRVFSADFDVHWMYQNRDNDKFLTLGKQGRKIGSCMPGYSTHVHKDHLSPLISWEQYGKL